MDTTEVFRFVASGLATVLVTLSLLALLTAAMGSVFRRYAARRERAAEAAGAEVEVSATPEAGITPERLAVLAAAAESTLGGPVRIVQVAERGPRAWALAGRKVQHSSRRVR